MKKALVVVLVLAACSVGAQGLKSATKTLTAGNWTVLRNTDPMTDKTTCTGVYKENYGIQLVSHSLYIRISGGIESVTLRFDGDTALPFRLGTKMEKDIRAVIVNGSEFSTLTGASRLRYQVSTLVSGVQNGDLDLAGIKEALAHINASCPLPEKT